MLLESLNYPPSEFNIAPGDLIKIGVAILCGAILGLERQYKNKTAGFRTIILICLGSCIFTAIAQRAGQGVNINIVTGIGFIGAGVIFKDNVSVNGLTTAAVIWISAAIGMAAGSGNYLLAIISTALTIAVLLLFHMVEVYIDKIFHHKLYIIVFTDADYKHLALFEDAVKAYHLKSFRKHIGKTEGCLQAAIQVSGHRKHINQLNEQLLKMPEVRSF